MQQRRMQPRRRVEEREPQPALGPGHPLLGQPVRNPPVGPRSNVLALQRLAGNGAVRSALGPPAPVQRWSLSDVTEGLADLAGKAWKGATTAYERAAAEVAKRTKSATGAQADEYLNATPVIKR